MLNRRVLLTNAGAATIVAASGGMPLRAWSQANPKPAMIVHRGVPLNAEPRPAKLAASFITPQPDFYIRCHGTIPQIAAGDYKLKVGGQGATTPFELSLSEMRSRFPERKVTADDQLKRVDIRAPQDGFVHQLAIHTVGGVVAPGEPIMMIVPSADDLTVEARIPSRDINQVHRGQETKLRFVSFNQRTTPELTGEISRVSADQITDPKTGQSFYTIRIALSKDEFARLGTTARLFIYPQGCGRRYTSCSPSQKTGSSRGATQPPAN